MHGSARVFEDVIKPPVGLVPDDGDERRHDHRAFGVDPASALLLHAVGGEPQPEGGLVEALQVNGKHGASRGVRGPCRQRLLEGLAVPERIEELVVRKLREGERAGRKADGGIHEIVHGRCAEEVPEGHRRLEVLWRGPRFRGIGGEGGTDCKPVRTELFHPDGCGAKELALLLVAGDEQAELVLPGLRGFFRAECEVLEARVGKGELLLLDLQPARVLDAQLKGKPRQLLRPVSRLHDDAEVDHVSGPVDTPVGEEVGIDESRIRRPHEPAGVEPAEVQKPSRILHGEEGHVVSA